MFSTINMLCIYRIFVRTIYLEQLLPLENSILFSQNFSEDELYILVDSLLKTKKDYTISSLSSNLSGILFALYYLLQSLEEMKLLVLLFIQIRPRWSNFYKILSRHLELCILFILDCPDFALLLEETQSTIKILNFYLSSIEIDINIL